MQAMVRPATRGPEKVTTFSCHMSYDQLWHVYLGISDAQALFKARAVPTRVHQTCQSQYKTYLSAQPSLDQLLDVEAVEGR
jgi:hypothetical protein